MSEPPRDDIGESAGSAPWERPRRWNQQRMDASKVDALLARLGNEDVMSGRRGRRRAGAGQDAQVSASELIASIGGSREQTDDVQDPTVSLRPEAGNESTVAFGAVPAAGFEATAEPEATAELEATAESQAAAGPPAVAGPPAAAGPPAGRSAPDGAADPNRADPNRPDPNSADQTVVFSASSIPDRGADRTISVRRDFGGPGSVSVPGSDDSATDEMVQFGQQEDVLAIRESLRQHYPGSPRIGVIGAGAASARSGRRTGATAATAAPGGHARSRGRRTTQGLFWAARGLIAIVSAAVLAYAGTEWNLIRTTDAGLQQKSGSYLQLTDPNISTPIAARPPSAGRTPNASQPAPVAPPAAGVTLYPPENLLLLGSDTRAGGNGDASNSDGTQTSAQSDTLMVAHISADRQNITILSIPRDLRIPAPHCKKWDYRTRKQSTAVEPVSPTEHWKITNAYSVGGPACSVLAVQHLTGLRMDRVIEIDFKGFKTMVDALGGVNVNICRPIRDQELGLIVAQGGVQKIQGDQALSLVRARKVQNDGIGNDYGRIHRQQVVLSTMLRQVTSAGTLLSPVKLDRFLHAFVDATYTDNVTTDSLIDLAHQLGNLAPGRVTFYTLPAHPNSNDGGDTQIMDAKGQAVFAALVNDQRLPGEEVAAPTTGASARTATAPTKAAATSARPSTSSANAGTTAASSTPPTSTTATTSLAPQTLSADPANIDLRIVNLTGKPGVAGQVMDELNAYGFMVTGNDLLRPVAQTQQEITVEYSDGHRADAVMVAAAIPGSRLVQKDGLDARVRLLLGTSFDGTVSGVSVGQTVPTRLQTTPSQPPPTASTSAPATTSTKASPTTSARSATRSAAGSPAQPSPTVTLKGTDLQSVNAGDATCA